jgi:hypothetical protein
VTKCANEETSGKKRGTPAFHIYNVGVRGFKTDKAAYPACVCKELGSNLRMNLIRVRVSQALKILGLCIMLVAAVAAAQQPVARPRQFVPGQLNRINELPSGRFRMRIESLPASAQARALQMLQRFHFTELDLKSLEADPEGGIYYVDMFQPIPGGGEADAGTPSNPVAAQTATPVSPFPAGLIFHSKPGAPNAIFLNFAGETIANTAWNTSLGRTTIPAVAFSIDSDFTTYTQATATPLVITGVANVVSTKPDADPDNLFPANKGILERNADVDVFSFDTGPGTISLSANPWLQPSGMRGGNLDVLIELHDESGAILMTNNPASQTESQIQTSLTAGRYYLYIRNTGAGDPMASTPTGYTSYGSIGQYFISGTLAPKLSPAPPTNLRFPN